MNAPTHIITSDIFVTSAERTHRRAILIHCPNCDDVEMSARCDLAAMRDAAMIGTRRATESAAAILGEVSRLATAAVYAPVETSRLIRIRAALNLTMEAARAIERAQR